MTYYDVNIAMQVTRINVMLKNAGYKSQSVIHVEEKPASSPPGDFFFELELITENNRDYHTDKENEGTWRGSMRQFERFIKHHATTDAEGTNK